MIRLIYEFLETANDLDEIMDKAVEKKGKNKILKELSIQLKSIGFERYKSNFFLRKRNSAIQFIHLHKFTFSPEFRIHFGIKASNNDDSLFFLDGLDSSKYQCKNSPNDKKYNFRFYKTEETIKRCVDNIFQFCLEVGEKWFEDNNEVKLS